MDAGKDKDIVSRDVWLQARAEVLAQEKKLTLLRAEVAAARRAMPWVRLEKSYVLEGPDGEVALGDVFQEQSQLAVYHIMFGPGWSSVCTGCTQWANAINSTTAAFPRADARMVAVSRAPIEEISAQKEKLGWDFTWLSSFRSDFNVDFYGSAGSVAEGTTATVGVETVGFDRGENHGVNIFYRDEGGQIFHTFSAFNRGIEECNGAFGYFDMLPKGRAW